MRHNYCYGNNFRNKHFFLETFKLKKKNDLLHFYSVDSLRKKSFKNRTNQCQLNLKSFNK